MIVGADALKGACLQRVSLQVQGEVSRCFDGLRAQLEAFRA
jgi:hypothetical protein